MEVKQRRVAVDRRRPSLSVARQCKLLDISRSGLYYQPAITCLLRTVKYEEVYLNHIRIAEMPELLLVTISGFITPIIDIRLQYGLN